MEESVAHSIQEPTPACHCTGMPQMSVPDMKKQNKKKNQKTKTDC